MNSSACYRNGTQNGDGNGIGQCEHTIKVYLHWRHCHRAPQSHLQNLTFYNGDGHFNGQNELAPEAL